MIRKAFKMEVYPEKVNEYRKLHSPIWKELKELLKTKGVYNYSIFHDRNTNALFGYAEIESEEKWTEIGESEICRQWWKFMAPLMETNADDSPKSDNLEEVFHLD